MKIKKIDKDYFLDRYEYKFYNLYVKMPPIYYDKSQYNTEPKKSLIEKIKNHKISKNTFMASYLGGPFIIEDQY